MRLSDWDKIGECLYRMEIPGGWLVLYETKTGGTFGIEQLHPAITFVPDPEHKWQLDERKYERKST